MPESSHVVIVGWKDDPLVRQLFERLANSARTRPEYPFTRFEIAPHWPSRQKGERSWKGTLCRPDSTEEPVSIFLSADDRPARRDIVRVSSQSQNPLTLCIVQPDGTHLTLTRTTKRELFREAEQVLSSVL